MMYKHIKTGEVYRLDYIFESETGGDFLVQDNGNCEVHVSMAWLVPV